jgi:hypothetical protein
MRAADVINSLPAAALRSLPSAPSLKLGADDGFSCS